MSNVSYPKMILFDYGHTLLYEPGWDPVRGNERLLQYATKNPGNCTLEDVRRAAEWIFGEHVEAVRKMGYEICGRVADKTLYEYLGIEFSLSRSRWRRCSGKARPWARQCRARKRCWISCKKRAFAAA